MAPPTVGTFSSSAVGSLTVSKSTLEKDILLALLVNTISTKQVKVDIKTGKKPVPTELKVLNNSTSLFQRSAIVRGLCGAALLNALDYGPFYLLGGHATPGSPEEAVALASISSWMSVAASTDPRDDAFSQALDRHLDLRAFLTPSANATVADLDLALTLFGNATAYGYPNVARWLHQCHAVCQQMAAPKGGPCGDICIPAPAVQPPTRLSAPYFDYEWETPPAKKEAAPPKQQADNNNKGGNNKQQQQQQQQQAKGEGKKKEKKAPAPAPAAGGGFDISALDIRVGKINKVWPHPEADKLFCEEIDVGEDKPRSIASGLRPFYKQEDMEGKMVLVLANLKPRTMLGFASHGMVLCSSNADHTKVEIVSPPEGTKVGERVEFEGFEGKDPEPQNKVAKKKIFEGLAPDLKTTKDGVVVWKEAQAKTSAGIVKGMPEGQVA
ncbi:tRNA synthase complex-interacting multifunctional protein 1 [Seminavis robusta]|uniref:tRNA synthase complex-interacting multifunctional protein 1 n=1 Tax=Seminavis robusta TaxID=568900 RepID=A0A9N8DK94_9STRA|nr:tRNA synthase complex-interacting multifunctional protein 1 [Seminavis robusta]|eukprot:Sro126_g060630.1 tRNA synthase complex-interacting multifunctional protein 1 (440) ;mRNA; f:89427-90746